MWDPMQDNSVILLKEMIKGRKILDYFEEFLSIKIKNDPQLLYFHSCQLWNGQFDTRILWNNKSQKIMFGGGLIEDIKEVLDHILDKDEKLNTCLAFKTNHFDIDTKEFYYKYIIHDFEIKLVQILKDEYYTLQELNPRYDIFEKPIII